MPSVYQALLKMPLYKFPLEESHSFCVETGCPGRDNRKEMHRHRRVTAVTTLACWWNMKGPGWRRERWRWLLLWGYSKCRETWRDRDQVYVSGNINICPC